MANTSRWSLSARQGFLVCGLFTSGLFVLCCGTGMSSIPVAALGVAVGLLGPIVIALSSIRANRPDVFGSAHVSQSSPPPTTGVTGHADLHLVVNAHGVHNSVVRIRDANVPVSKWPDVGATLPVLIPNGNPRRLQVLWDQVRGHHDFAMDDVSYSPYLEEEYVDESEDYEGYPIDEPIVEQPSLVEPVVDESPEPDPEPIPAADVPVSLGAATAPVGVATAPASEAATLVSESAAPARRRPSPRPRRQTTPADALLETQPGVVEAKSAAPAAIERADPVVPAGGLFIGSSHPPAEDTSATVGSTAPPIEPPAAPADVPIGGGSGEATTLEFPLPRRVPGSTKAGPARDADRADESAAREPDPYVASYLADDPEDRQQGLNGVHNVSVTVIVSDLRRSLTFYRDLLGLTEIDGGMGSAILVSGNARILLRQVTDTRPVDRRVVHLNLEVDDVHEAYERLRREGVEFMHPPRVVNQGEQLEQWAATLRDPDGHAIALTHWEVHP